MENLYGRMIGELKRQTGIMPLERLAKSAGFEGSLLPIGPMRGASYKAGIQKTLPGILAAKFRLGERPIGGPRGE